MAAYGNADQRDWRTTGVCFDVVRRNKIFSLSNCKTEIFQELNSGTTVQVRQQSGGSNDCIESTGWPYNKFTVHNTANNA